MAAVVRSPSEGAREADGRRKTQPPYKGCDRQPRFSSALVDHGYVHNVEGVDKLEPGRYPFTCQVHSQMRGTLVVEEPETVLVSVLSQRWASCSEILAAVSRRAGRNSRRIV
jgi:hypothetical protein